MAQMHQDAPKWLDMLGSQCVSCGKQREIKYLFPVYIQGKSAGVTRHTKRMVVICLECVAAQRYPKGLDKTDLPWYDPKGNRLNPKEKVHVFMG